jgi:hypothetical protein
MIRVPSAVHRIKARRNSIQATVDCDGAFDATPRWLYQARNILSRAIDFAGSRMVRAALS